MSSGAALNIPSAMTLIIHLFPDPDAQSKSLAAFAGAAAVGNGTPFFSSRGEELIVHIIFQSLACSSAHYYPNSHLGHGYSTSLLLLALFLPFSRSFRHRPLRWTTQRGLKTQIHSNVSISLAFHR